jgi:hypothetical protein
MKRAHRRKQSLVAAATFKPVTITLSWTPLSGIGMMVMGTEDKQLIEQLLLGAIKELGLREK